MKNHCRLCPVECLADRTTTVGYCGEKNAMRIAKYYLHAYEEPVICGGKGSGTIFFCGCSLKCVFCQNYVLSRSETGKIISPQELADIFKELEDRGACNINLVTPSHFVPQIIEAFKIYRPKVPVVYNTHSYERIETLREIDPFVDVYLPDLKFFSPERSMRYTKKKDYFDVASNAIKFMMNSKPTAFDANGQMTSGVIVRHLILPLGVEDSQYIVDWFAKNSVNGAYLSLMAQYTPFGEIKDLPELNRKITAREYDRVYERMLSDGIENYFVQERKAADESFIPKWDF